MRWVWRISGLLLMLTALTAPAAADSPPQDAIALTFGRCDLDTKTCQPHSAGAAAAGGPEFQSGMLRCFGDALGRPVYARDSAAAAAGLWLDVSFSAKQPPNGAQTLTMVLMRDADSIEASLYVVLPRAKDYENACHQFAERIGGEID